MRKVISLLLAVVMLISVFAVLPSASAAETIYKAGTEVQVTWGFPHVDELSGTEFYILYDTNKLEYVENTATCPHVSDAFISTDFPGDFCIIISNVTKRYDVSSDHVVFSSNFIVKEDTSDLSLEANVDDLYVIDGVDFIDIEDRSNEFNVVVISEPTEPEPKTVYFVNTGDWENVNAYAWNDSGSNALWPGVVATKTDLTDPNGKEVYSYSFTEDYVNVIFNNGSGLQTADLTVSDGENKYYYFAESVWYDSLDAIPVITEGTTAPPVVSLMGDATDWETGAEMTAVDGVYTTTLQLAEGTYEFKVKVNDTWYGNDGTIVDTTTTSSETGWDMFDGAGNCKLQASGGTYTFNFDTTTNKIIVLAEIDEKPSEDTTPSEEPSEDTTPVEYMNVYFQNNWNWSNINVHYWGSAAENTTWPGTAMEFYDNDGIYDVYVAKVPTDVEGIIINGTKDDGSGNIDQTPDIKEGFYDGVCYSMAWDNGNQVVSSNINDVIKPEDTTPSEEPSEDTTPSEEPSEDTTPSEEPSETLKNGIYEEDGALYYYVDGVKTYAGLIMIGDDYYYVNSSCVVVAGRDYYVSKTNYLLPRGGYLFDETGKMINPPVKETTESTEAPAVKNGIFEEDGVLYYYKDNAKFYAGLIMIDGYYYYVNSSCMVITSRTYYVSKTNYLLPSAAYTFGVDGKMLNPPVEETTEPPTEDTGAKNGFVVENGVTYYYVDGVKTYAGLIEIDGYYYYVNSSCIVIKGKAYTISKTNNLLERGAYSFDVEGKMINPPGN